MIDLNESGISFSGSVDNTPKVRDIESGQILASFSGDALFLTCTISADSRTIVAGGASSRVHFLRLIGV